MFFDRGGDPNRLDDIGRSSTTWAVNNNAVNCICLLVERRADLNVADKDGASPLHYAACQNHLECLRLLLTGDVDPSMSDNNGLMPTRYTRVFNHQGHLTLLLRNGAIDNFQEQAPQNQKSGDSNLFAQMSKKIKKEAANKLGTQLARQLVPVAVATCCTVS